MDHAPGRAAGPAGLLDDADVHAARAARAAGRPGVPVGGGGGPAAGAVDGGRRRPPAARRRRHRGPGRAGGGALPGEPRRLVRALRQPGVAAHAGAEGPVEPAHVAHHVPAERQDSPDDAGGRGPGGGRGGDGPRVRRLRDPPPDGALRRLDPRGAAGAAPGLQRHPPDIPDPRPLRALHGAGDEPAADHGPRRGPGRSRRDSPVRRRLARPLGGRHAGRRDRQVHRPAELPGLEPAPARRGAIHPRRRGHHPLRVHGHRPDHLDQPVGRRGADGPHRGADVRVRLPRGQPRHPAHPRDQPQPRAAGGRGGGRRRRGTPEPQVRQVPVEPPAAAGGGSGQGPVAGAPERQPPRPPGTGPRLPPRPPRRTYNAAHSASAPAGGTTRAGPGPGTASSIRRGGAATGRGDSTSWPATPSTSTPSR